MKTNHNAWNVVLNTFFEILNVLNNQANALYMTQVEAA